MELYLYRIHAGKVICKRSNSQEFSRMLLGAQAKYVIYITSSARWVRKNIDDHGLPVLSLTPEQVDPRIRAYHLINS